MKIYRSLSDAPADPGGRAIAIGVFDGVHLGHRAVIAAAGDIAEASGLSFAVMTFEPHPRTVLRPGAAGTYLTGPEIKAELIAELGPAELIVVPFTPALARVTAERFAQTLMSSPLDGRALGVGANFRFGNGGSGDADLLRDVGAGAGVQVVSPGIVTSDDGDRISSTRIRGLVAEGDVETAATLLGRYHLIQGPVIAGAGRGRTLGIPTANLDLPTDQAVPAAGVYAARLHLGSDSWPAAVNIGRAPTFAGDADSRMMVEAHAIGYDGPDFYDEDVRITFRARLRDEKRFSAPEELVQQIHADIAEAGRIAAE